MKHNQPDPTIPPVMADAPMNQPLDDYGVPTAPRRNSIARRILFVLIGLSALLNLFILLIFIFYVDRQAGGNINIFTTMLVLPLCIPIIVWRRRMIIRASTLIFFIVISILSYYFISVTFQIILSSMS